MPNPIKVSDILSTEVDNGDAQSAYENIYISIADHFRDNAVRMATNAVSTHQGCKIEIDIPVNGIVTLKITNTELIRERK